MSPIEALENTITASYMRRYPNVPGAVITRTRGEQREALRNLTSDQALRMWFYDPIGETPEMKLSKMKLTFDQKLRFR